MSQITNNYVGETVHSHYDRINATIT